MAKKKLSPTSKNTSIWIEPEVQKELKILSIKNGMPVGEIIDGLIRFMVKTQDPEFYSLIPSKLRAFFQAQLESCFFTSMSEVRQETKRRIIEGLTSDEQAKILARHEEKERRIREAFEQAGLPYPDDEGAMGEIQK